MVTVLLSLLIQPAFAADVAGVKLAETIESGGQQLQLNGYGIRKKLFFKIYVGSLYTAQPASSSDQVINGAGGKLIRMNFLYSKVEKEKIIDGFAEGIKKNSPELVKDPAVISFLGWFDADFIEGDQVDLAISADGTVSANHNNRSLGTLKSPALARGVLLIYLGNHPADSDMKKGMLGKY
jgi:hypothetical protein